MENGQTMNTSSDTGLREVRLWQALVTVLFMVAAMLLGVIALGAEPQIPLVLGCVMAALMAMLSGYRWETILESMIEGITQLLEAVLILLLIGMLVGVWIACGTVPTMIYYGLKLISANIFPLATVLLCTLIAFAIGAWGTVGTIGIAFMGIGTALDFPPALTAGCVISGAYLGEIISPLSDATNLAAAVVGENVFDAVKKVLAPAITVMVIACVFYLVTGLRHASAEPAEAMANVDSLRQALSETIRIHPVTLVPLLLMIVSILIKIPAIPAMLIGILSGAIAAVLTQKTGISVLLECVYSGYVCSGSNETVNTLLTAGGMMSMMNTISVIIIAMAFGGIMQKTGQMEALVGPIVRRIRSKGGLKALSVVVCLLMNALMADQYLGISVPGQMFSESYRERGLSQTELAAVLLGGGATTSPLIPWNTCGMYVTGLLGVGTLSYLPYAFIPLAMPIATILFGFIAFRPKQIPASEVSD